MEQRLARLPAEQVVPLVQDQFDVAVARLDHIVLRDLDIPRKLLGRAGVAVEREEVHRGFLLFQIRDELAPPLDAFDVRQRGSPDLDIRETFFQMPDRDIKELDVFADGPGPALMPEQVGLVPDLPVDDPAVESVRPALVLVPDDVLADPRPLVKVLRGDCSVMFDLVFDRGTEAVEDFGPGFLNRVEIGVGQGEVVGRRIILVGVKVRKDLVDVDGAPPFQRRVVQTGVGDPRRGVRLVAPHFVVARRTVVDAVHVLDLAERLGKRNVYVSHSFSP